MTDAIPPTAPPPVSAAAPLDAAAEAKKKRYATWSRWAGILVAIAAAIRIIGYFLPHH
jgi:hypothetical protein